MKNSALIIIEKAAEMIEDGKAESKRAEMQKALSVLISAIAFDGYVSNDFVKKVLIDELPNKILSLPLRDLPSKSTLRKFFNGLKEGFEKLFNPPYVEQETAPMQNEKIFFKVRDKLLKLLKSNTPPEIPKIISESYIKFTENYMMEYWGKM